MLLVKERTSHFHVSPCWAKADNKSTRLGLFMALTPVLGPSQGGPLTTLKNSSFSPRCPVTDTYSAGASTPCPHLPRGPLCCSVRWPRYSSAPCVGNPYLECTILCQLELIPSLSVGHLPLAGPNNNLAPSCLLTTPSLHTPWAMRVHFHLSIQGKEVAGRPHPPSSQRLLFSSL